MRFSLFVAVAVVVSLAIAPIGAAAVVQEDAPTDAAANETDAVNESADPINQQLERSEIKQKIDPTLAITEWSYEDRTFTLTFRSLEEQEIVVAEAIRAEEGSGRMTWDTYDVEAGNSTIEVPVRTAPQTTRKGAAVTIASDRSREAGHASYVSSGMIEPNREPVDYQVTQFAIIGSAVGGAGFALRIVRKRRADEDKGSERII